jgi:hypothetical protein
VYACGNGIVQPVMKTLEELKSLIADGETFYCEILEEGIPLFDAGNYFASLSHLAAEARQRRRLQRTPAGWRWRDDFHS